MFLRAADIVERRAGEITALLAAETGADIERKFDYLPAQTRRGSPSRPGRQLPVTIRRPGHRETLRRIRRSSSRRGQ